MQGRSIPTPNEAMILRLLWRQGPQTVRQVRDGLSAQKKLAYTSVLTIVNVLVRKGWLERRRLGRADVYSPVLDETRGKLLILQELAGRLFDGSLPAIGEFLLACEESPPLKLPAPPAAVGRVQPPRIEPVPPEATTFVHSLEVDLL